MLNLILFLLLVPNIYAQSESFEDFELRAKNATQTCLGRGALSYSFRNVNNPEYRSYQRSFLIRAGDAMITRPVESILGGVGELVTHFNETETEQRGFKKLAYLKHLVRFAASEVDLKFSYQRINRYHQRSSGNPNLSIIRPKYFEAVYTPYIQTIAKACFLKCVTSKIYTYNGGAGEPDNSELLDSYFDGTDNNPQMVIERGAPICRHYADLYHELAPEAGLRTTRTSTLYKNKINGHSFIRLDFYRLVENKVYENFFYLEPQLDSCNFLYEDFYQWQNEAMRFYQR